MNAQTESLFGYSRDELLGQAVEILIPHRFRRHHPEYVRAFLACPASRPMGAGRDLFGLRKDGSEIPIEIGLNRIETQDGVFGVAAIVDITRRKAAEQTLRESEAMLHLVVESTPNALVMLDDLGRITLANSTAERMFGYAREELMGQPVEILIPERLRLNHPEYRRGFMADPKARPMGAGRDLFGRRKDGTEIPVEIGLSPITTGEGVRVLAAIVDITGRKRAEQELKAFAENLRQINAELEQFAYVASHDLQEPLRAVAGCVQLLQQRYQGRLDQRADELIFHIVEGAGRMQRLIQDLLAFSRVGTRGQQFKPTELQAVLDAALANLKAAIEESHATVTHDPLPTVSADPAQFVQLFQNLIGNALKFHSPGRPPVIHVGARRQGQAWIVTVRDNGIGIEPQYFERIFDVFQRLHTRREYPGTGIGLAICRKIVERHGGRIWLESTPGEGTTFSFSIPEHKPPEPAEVHGS